MQFYLLIALTLFVGLSAAGRGDFNGREQEMVKISVQLYANTGKPILPKRTLELLKRLEVLYSCSKAETSRAKQEELLNLIEAAEISPLKCKEESFANLESLISKYAYASLNMVPYLKNCRYRLRQVCGQHA